MDKVEHSRLVAGQTQGQHPGHRFRVGTDGVDRSGPRCLLWSRWNYTGFAFFRLLKLNCQLVLHLANGGEILIKLDLVRLPYPGHESLALVLDGRENALAEHDARIRLPIIAVRVLEPGSKNPGVQTQRRRFWHGKGDSGAGRVTDRLARHRCVNVEYLEASRGADCVGDPGI